MAEPIKLDQVVTCTRCGTKSQPASRSKGYDPEVHRSEGALLLEWRIDGRSETHGVAYVPELCPSCSRSSSAPPPPPKPKGQTALF